MPAFTYNEMVQETMNGNGFRSRESRQMATRVSNYLNKAAEALEKQEETKALAESLRGYATAVKNVAAAPGPRTRGQITDALKTLDGFSDFMEAEDASGVSNYEKLVNELEAGGASATDIKGDLEYLNVVVGLQLYTDELEAQRKRHNQASAQNRPPQASNPQPQAGALNPQPQVSAPNPQPQASNVSQPAPGNPQPQANPPQPVPEEEYERTEGALNINAEKETMGPLPGPKEEEVLPAETAEFNEIKVPDKENPTAAEAFDQFYREKIFWMTGNDAPAMAVDENGKAWTKPEEIKSELMKPGRRLFVFTDDGSLPHAFENRGGKLYASNGGIGMTNQLPGKARFEPKKSLKATDIADIPSYKGVKSTEEHSQDYSLKLKVIDYKLDHARTDLKEAQKWFEGGELSDKVIKKPKEPGTGSRIWRWTVKFFTAGFGETKTYREYKNKVKEWEDRTKEAEQQLKELPDKIKELEATRAEYQKIKNEYSRDNTKFKSEYYQADPEAKKEGIRNYRKHTEVRMEGVADLLKNGRVTPENIFANTWLKKAACEGKKTDDPEAVKSLKEYIVSRTVEEETLKQTIEDKEYAAARNERMVDVINNGSGMQKMEKDGIFRKLLQEQGNKTIDPEKIYETYRERSQQRDRERNHPLYKLEAERKAVIKDFGKKEISADCINDVTRLGMLDRAIRNAKQLPKDVRDIPEDTMKKYNKELAKVYKKLDLRESIKPESKEAIKQLSQASANKGKTFTLDQMTEMVNKQVQKNGPQKQAGM